MARATSDGDDESSTVHNTEYERLRNSWCLGQGSQDDALRVTDRVISRSNVMWG